MKVATTTVAILATLTGSAYGADPTTTAKAKAEKPAEKPIYELPVAVLFGNGTETSGLGVSAMYRYSGLGLTLAPHVGGGMRYETQCPDEYSMQGGLSVGLSFYTAAPTRLFETVAVVPFGDVTHGLVMLDRAPEGKWRNIYGTSVSAGVEFRYKHFVSRHSFGLYYTDIAPPVRERTGFASFSSVGAQF